MGGGLLQLIATGAQDQYLTGNPQITYFSSTQKRYSNFSMESIPQQFIGTTSFGRKSTCSLSRNGDLVSSCMLEIQIPALVGKPATDGDVIKVSGAFLDGENEVKFDDKPFYTIDKEGKPTNNTFTAFNEAGVEYSPTKFIKEQLVSKVEILPIDKAKIFGADNKAFQLNHDGSVTKKEIPESDICRDVDGTIIDVIYRIKADTNEYDPNGDMYLVKPDTADATLRLFKYILNSRKVGEQEVCWDTEAKIFRNNVRWVNNLGTSMIERVEINVGGQRIDSHTGEIMHLLSELTMPASKRVGYKAMVHADSTNGCTPRKTLFVPLRFWFNDTNYGNALPLLALQYHEVQISIDFKDISKLVMNGGSATSCLAASSSYTLNTACFDVQLYADYIYLDTAERKKMATEHHEYLIQQVQFTGDETITAGCRSDRFRLNFNHPVKALIWVLQKCGQTEPTFFPGVLKEAKLLMNGHDRFSQRDADYFRLYQPYAHWRRVPEPNIQYGIDENSIYSYSFCLNAVDHQASGTANFSRVDAAQLELHLKDEFVDKDTNYVMRVYAINYNVIRIMGGLGGLAYSS